MRRSKRCIQRAEAHFGEKLKLTDDARASLRAMADGDGRYLLNLVEELSTVKIGEAARFRRAGRRPCKNARRSTTSRREEHYNIISALHKSIRGSDPDAALYWLARMLAGGEQPLYIARRLVRAAVEDIGMADPQAHWCRRWPPRTCSIFSAARKAKSRLAQCVIYLATRAEIERRLHGLERRQARRRGTWLADAAGAHPQRADQADEEPRLRQGL